MPYEVFYSNGTEDECSEHGWPQGWYWCYQPLDWPKSKLDGPHGPFNTKNEAELAIDKNTRQWLSNQIKNSAKI